MICRVCEGPDLELVLDLGTQPWGNHFLRPEEVGTEPEYPLRLVLCSRCRTAQLDHTVPKETMFSDHTYLSGTTRSLRQHFARVAVEVNERFLAGSSAAVLDIGSNDGTQLQCYQSLGHQVLGVESSSKIAAIAAEAGVPTLTAFYSLEAQRAIGEQFDVINASGVFFHLEELHSVCEAIREGLKADGVFVVQFIYMRMMQEHTAFDQIYHEHLLYYTLESIQRLLGRHGLELFDAEVAPIHGGSVIGFVGHAGRRPRSERLDALEAVERSAGTNTRAAYDTFAERTRLAKEQTCAWVDTLVEARKVVYGLGAPVKGNTLLNYFRLGPDRVQALVERNELRRGLVSPGMHIPIRMEDEVAESPDAYLVLAWNFKREILERHSADVASGVEFYFPVDPDR